MSLIKIELKLNKKQAMTLAEVLITLGIVGVVCAITIPTLIHANQENEFKAAWKKAFSAINQASLMIINDNSLTMTGIFANNNKIRDTFAQYMNVVQKCDSGTTLDNCWNINYYFLNGTFAYDTSDPYFKNGSRMILADGTFVYFNDAAPSCNLVTGNTPTNGVCGRFMVDVNGGKGPNRYGKDIFEGWIQSNKIVPYGSNGDIWSTDVVGNCTPTSQGDSCSTLYLFN